MDARLLCADLDSSLIRVERTLRGHERDEVFQPTHRDMSVLSAWGRNITDWLTEPGPATLLYMYM